MSSTYLQRVFAEARLRILMLLDDVPDGGSHAGLIDSALDDAGTPISRDQVEAQLWWLADQGLLKSEKIASITRYTITREGKDVARGQRVVPGVMRRSDID